MMVNIAGYNVKASRIARGTLQDDVRRIAFRILGRLRGDCLIPHRRLAMVDRLYLIGVKGLQRNGFLPN